MKAIIQEFVTNKRVAVAGASNNKDNFGTYLMKELAKKDYETFPVNPKCREIEGKTCLPSVRELPGEVENLILAVPASLTEEIAEQCLGTAIKRVWMVKGVGKGAYSEKAHKLLEDNGIGVVYGFCPMMFFGEGMHKFHFWLRKTFGTLPGAYKLSLN